VSWLSHLFHRHDLPNRKDIAMSDASTPTPAPVEAITPAPEPVATVAPEAPVSTPTPDPIVEGIDSLIAEGKAIVDRHVAELEEVAERHAEEIGGHLAKLAERFAASKLSPEVVEVVEKALEASL
jgi:hypothetical protein